MEIDDAAEMVFREALRRLGPKALFDPILFQEKIAEVVRQHGQKILAQLSEVDRQLLRREGLEAREQVASLGRINELIDYCRSLVAKYGVKAVNELPHEEQLNFARLWARATGGAKSQEN